MSLFCAIDLVVILGVFSRGIQALDLMIRWVSGNILCNSYPCCFLILYIAMHIPWVKQPIKIQRNCELGINHIQMQPTVHVSHQSHRECYISTSIEHITLSMWVDDIYRPRGNVTL